MANILWTQVCKVLHLLHTSNILYYYDYRPMYVDSTSTAGDASDQSVAKLLRVHVEPLLLVSVTRVHNLYYLI